MLWTRITGHCCHTKMVKWSYRMNTVIFLCQNRDRFSTEYPAGYFRFVNFTGADFLGGAHPPNIYQHPPPKKKNIEIGIAFKHFKFQARFAFITQKNHRNVHKDLLRPKSIDTMSF